jgi:hypothetical protein
MLILYSRSRVTDQVSEKVWTGSLVYTGGTMATGGDVWASYF